MKRNARWTCIDITFREMKTPSSLEELIAALRCLPGVGPKSAQRMAYHLLQRDRPGAARLGERARAGAREDPPLREVQQLRRGRGVRAVPLAPARRGRCCASWNRPGDLLMMEQAQCYQGLYFVLMGALSPLDGIGPEGHPSRPAGAARGRRRRCGRSILATNFTVEGEATAHYVGELLRAAGPQGDPHRARAAGRRRARARGQRHARAGGARAAGRLKAPEA